MTLRLAAVAALILPLSACLNETEVAEPLYRQLEEVEDRLDGRIAALEEKHDAELAALEEKHDRDVTALQDRVTTLEGIIGSADGEGELGVLRRLAQVEVALDDDAGSLVDVSVVVGRVGELEGWRSSVVDPTLADHGVRITELEDWRVTDVDPTLADHEVRITDLEDGQAVQDGRLGIIESDYATVDYVDGQIALTEAYCDDADIVLGDDLRGEIGDLDAEIPEWILADTTWTVDGVGSTSTTFATPAEAVDAAQAVRIAPDAVLTIEIDDGRYTASVPLEIRHPDGAQLEIVGNTTDPSLVVLEFTGSDGIVVQDGYVLGLLDGVTVEGDGAGVQKAGILVDGSMARLGENMVFDGFSGYGLWARSNALLVADGVRTRSNSIDGIFVDHGSVLMARDVLSQSNRYGLFVSGGSYAEVTDGEASGNREIGFYAINGSAINAVRAFSVANTSDGFHAYVASSIYAPFASANSNRNGGYLVQGQSVCVAGGGSGNVGGTYSPPVGVVGNGNSINLP